MAGTVSVRTTNGVEQHTATDDEAHLDHDSD
jgi:hypothetical protein